VVVVSYSGKEINAKLVYYGCGLCGKTTNLESIYEAVPDTSRGKMVSMKTQSDRTLFFDLLPLDLGEIMGFKTRFLLYTVPGQVFYNATRKLVLKGADAIVFVADSEIGKMEENKDSLENLRANLAEYSVDLDDLPWLIQYNKRDLPNVYSLDELQAGLNPGGKVPHYEAVAPIGKGVFETFRGISHLLMEKVTKELRRGGSPPPARRPAAEAAKPAAVAAAAATNDHPASKAPTSAPARAIEREAQETRAAEPVAPVSETDDYGREILLGDEIPPRGDGDGGARGAAEREMAPVGARPALDPPPGVTKNPAAGNKARPKASANPSSANPSSADRNLSLAEPTTVVVPVKLPVGGTAGIVIKIVFERQD